MFAAKQLNNANDNSFSDFIFVLGVKVPPVLIGYQDLFDTKAFHYS